MSRCGYTLDTSLVAFCSQWLELFAPDKPGNGSDRCHLQAIMIEPKREATLLRFATVSRERH